MGSIELLAVLLGSATRARRQDSQIGHPAKNRPIFLMPTPMSPTHNVLTEDKAAEPSGWQLR
jgi:hypothetical protein